MKYFDYKSTTNVASEIQKTYAMVLDKYYINSESIYPSGVEVNSLMEKSREQIASLLSVRANEIIFTSGGSEANNLALKGVALKRQNIGKHIITSCIEHSSVMNSCKWLEQYFGFEITYLPVDQDGVVIVDELKKAIRDDTVLVSVMAINNETGSIQPINEIKSIVKKYHNAYMHVDCVQALGKMKLDLSDIDMASFSAHKINGLKGCGFLMKKQHVVIAELISGGQQENHLRGGTANSPANIVLGKTVRIAIEKQEERTEKVQKLHDYFYNSVKQFDKVVMNSPFNGSPYVCNFSCLTITSQVMMNALNKKGFEVSAVSTCDSNDAISRVVEKMYPTEINRLKGTIRVSLSYQHEMEDVEELLKAIKEIIDYYG